MLYSCSYLYISRREICRTIKLESTAGGGDRGTIKGACVVVQNLACECERKRAVQYVDRLGSERART